VAGHRARKILCLVARRRPAWLRTSGWVVVSLFIALVPALSSCSSEEPPDITVAALGAAVGDAKMDDVDFSTLLESFTSESYRAGTQPDQANYQLYLTAKAADLGLNKPGPGNIQVDKQVSGKTASFSFTFVAPEGVFAVADVGRIDVSLVRTDSDPYPWRVERIALSR